MHPGIKNRFFSMSLRTSIAKYVLNLVRINLRENVQLLVLFFFAGGANPLGAGDISETHKYITKSPDGKFGKRGNGVARDTLMIFSEELRISILYPVKCVTDTLGSDSFSSLQNYSLIAIPREMPLLRNSPYLRLWGHIRL